MSTAVPVASTPADDASIAPGRDEHLFLLLSIFIGVISGLLVVCFRVSIEWLKVLTLGSAPHPGQWRLLYVPATAGILVGLLVRFLFPQARGSGVNQTKAALYVYNGYISSRTVAGKFITSALAIGAGHSLGPEDPSLQIGAGVASLVSRQFNISRQRLRMFAPIGAAAGLAAAFNAPISAILFVIEEVIGNWNAAVLGSIVLSAISSVVIARFFWGAQPMFRIPTVDLRDPRELPAYAVLGVVGGIASLVFSRALQVLRPRLRRLPAATQWLQPGIAGLMVGAIGFFGFPQVMGPGYEVMDQAMHGHFTWQILLILAALKIIATTLSFSSGTPGGMFAPTLFIGAMLGASVGSAEKVFFTHLSSPVGSYALVGMGVLFAGFIRAPLTSVFMVLEVSGNYSIILPVILANTIAYLIARTFAPVPIFEDLTLQDGLDLPSMEERREETGLALEDAMQPAELLVFAGGEKSSVVASAMSNEDAAQAMIRCRGNRWYVLSQEDAAKLGAEAPEQEVEGVIPTERTPVLYPDMPLYGALPHFRRWPVLPISNRALPGKLEGTLTQQNVLDCYRAFTH